MAELEPGEVEIPLRPEVLSVVRKTRAIRIKDMGAFLYEVHLQTPVTSEGWSEVVFLVQQGPPDGSPKLLGPPEVHSHVGRRFEK